jgi:hypothetical protein
MTENEFLHIVRASVTEKSQGTVDVTFPNIKVIITPSLTRWVLQAQKKEVRNALRKTFSTNLDIFGRLDLTPYLDGSTAKIILESIKDYPLKVNYSGQIIELLWTNNYFLLNNFHMFPLGSSNTEYNNVAFLDGNIINTRGDDTITFFANLPVEFQAVAIPRTILEIPETIVGDFIEFIVAALITRIYTDSRAPIVKQ